MSRHLIDHDRIRKDGSRAAPYALLERQMGGEAMHPKIQMLARRRKGSANPDMVKQFLRIARGRLA